MRVKHPAAQVTVFVVAAMLIAVIANGFADRTRRLVLPGWYPNALRVPPPERPPAATTTMAPTTTVAPATTTTVAETTTVAQSPAPGQPPVVVDTTTIARPAGTTTTQQPSNPATQQPSNQPRTPATNLAKFTPHPDKAYIEISGDDAVALHGAGALFLDARRSSVFEEGHIPGSRSFSVWEADVDDKVTALYEERSDPAEQNKPIVVYCSGGACEDSHMLSQKLWGLQFNNVYVYKDGFPDWQKRGLPVRTGATP